ncbi:lathosterol oxidase, putative [Trypanosoma equiperdum]|uniref:Lathosterol oxidase, putative n=2 Tax=Trypanozoon TaxID=39700 RepID=Q57YY9_TRYB2|nr:lathosterol oxidase, putative [Trypanosoma brucei brucei TREU927]AAX79685.1 lathosterol oxidase, putative [Trypanosoma brucei]AAZ13089.1 lathosterol oxidase, putative [Trypanosoma brucei brucei TREU927]SCU66126.1 lathosterol oxidase, putative [Trypanosoma equiperdum]
MEVAFDVYASLLPVDRNSLRDQMFVYWLLLTTGGIVMYLLCASFSTYLFFFEFAETYFPRTIAKGGLHDQIIHEIFIAVASVPFMAILMTPAAVLSHRGYSKLYYNVDDYGWPYLFFSAALFFVFTDFMVYWFHRGLHHPTLYRHLHKLHHTYKYTTPFSSHAFNPCDGFGQGVPYYAFIFIFPVHHYLFVLLFMAVNLWTVSIHDQVDFGGHIINTTGHHTIHHEKFSYDYGQYFTFWDRIGGTYKAAKQTHSLSLFGRGGRVSAQKQE